MLFDLESDCFSMDYLATLRELLVVLKPNRIKDASTVEIIVKFENIDKKYTQLLKM